MDGVFKPAERDFTYVKGTVEETILGSEKGVGPEIYNIRVWEARERCKGC